MPRYLTGDELGNIKSLHFSPASTSEFKLDCKSIHDGTAQGRKKGVQGLCMVPSGSEDQAVVAAATADGCISISNLTADDELLLLHEWSESRLKPEQTFIGLAGSNSAVYSCTSNGALRMAVFSEDGEPSFKLAALPARLCQWRLASNQETFTYGGDEVELSVCNTERSFSSTVEQSDASDTTGKKRKRSNVLLPGEVWRAKNVPNDFLGLRRPVHNTCLTYLPSSSDNSHHLLAGTRLGDVRRYDTRAGRRPVSDWTGVGKVGGVNAIEAGQVNHQVFVADRGSNLFALDLRNGKICYGYKGISGTVTSISPSPSILASASFDRYVRIHSTFPPPEQLGAQQGQKGAILEKVYMTSVPTVVIWDQRVDTKTGGHADDDDEAEGLDDLLGEMKNVGAGVKGSDDW